MVRRPPTSTRTSTLFPYTTLFRTVGLNNYIYLQVGLITTIGVSAKNAILIVEFAEEKMREGLPPARAALEAGKLRLRPILMTSFAFVFGVLPLALAKGAGAGGQNAIGWAVVGGMLSATVLAIFLDRKSSRLNSSH